MQSLDHLLFSIVRLHQLPSLFFFNDTATTEIYTLSLHDALPISSLASNSWKTETCLQAREGDDRETIDRKSTRLNSSHSQISYAVFCLKKKKRQNHHVLPCPPVRRGGPPR